MARTKLTSEGRVLAGFVLAFVVVVVLAATDLALDVSEGISLGHAVMEGGIIVLGAFGAVGMSRRLTRVLDEARDAQAQAVVLAERLQATEAEATRWREETQQLVRGLGAAIDRQFERWALSPAEREVGLLLLKGLSHKELADVRSITEATARQQSRAVYKKAGLAGRNELSAFFLEDLLLPSQGEPASASSKSAASATPAPRLARQ